MSFITNLKTIELLLKKTNSHRKSVGALPERGA
jgi:hypothetical protein